MARHLNRLTARSVATLKKPGRHGDGGNLNLAISRTASKRWTFLYISPVTGGQREGGLGSASAVSLAQARSAAAEWRSLLAKGNRPARCKEGRQYRRSGAANLRAVCRGAHCFEALRVAQRRACEAVAGHNPYLLRGNPRPAGGHDRYCCGAFGPAAALAINS